MELDAAVWFTAPVVVSGWVLGLALLAGLLFALLRFVVAAALRQVLEQELARFAQTPARTGPDSKASEPGAAAAEAARNSRGEGT
ncbi:hypothetical protein [Oceanithermus desulfurans]|uniref:Uncharacterized protein n=2 Tax=Oceanithermus desulfurans TaxID=227924 RepID=A0A511RLY2_9DEIN|nr:hypothetical protein [Oceanithermus desulfurans]MBB6029844.1 hypothetical protein [Oceanithermus desulfurans]GEM89806.1 hypothetical protein ODE01S_12400 [Oceanithermus desulfurans NBRC 100063]